jgi:pSer/pThr/pTyr-binding forkhead associated (FHA) protein
MRDFDGAPLNPAWGLTVPSCGVSTYQLKFRGTRVPIRRGETVLGRSPYSSIVVSNSLASRQHCAIRLGPDGLSIVDLNSANGTAVNGERLFGERRLEPGDVLRIGTDVLEVVSSTSGPVRAMQPTHPDPPDEGIATGVYDFADPSNRRACLGLLEALVSSAAASQKPNLMGPAIQHAADGLLARAQADCLKLSASDAVRIAAVVENVAGWFGDGSLEGWRRRSLEALEALRP